jgi:hypothetical protein
VSDTPGADPTPAIVLERYRYILAQIQSVNESAYKFLGLFQTLTTAIVAGGLSLFVGYKKWGIPPPAARTGVVGLLVLETIVAAFTAALIVAGMASWMDYRREETELTDTYFKPGFRSSPRLRNMYRWYEPYMLALVLVATAALWILTLTFVIPNIV